MDIRICPHCKKEFTCNGRVFSNHVRWCLENPLRSKLAGEEYKEKARKASEKRLNEKLGKLKDFEVTCNTCGRVFIVQEREKQFPKKEKYFCSQSCAKKRVHSNETKLKIQEGLWRFSRETKGLDSGPRYCVICGKITGNKSNKAKTCSPECHAELIKLNSKKKTEKLIADVAGTEKEYKIKLRIYRNACAFKFALNDYPEEFDFELIKKYGWYSPSNKKNNLGGVSRDHMYSVKEGFENNVNPDLLSHPANCKLLIHNDNVSKHKASSITLEELKERIASWDAKYNK